MHCAEERGEVSSCFPQSGLQCDQREQSGAARNRFQAQPSATSKPPSLPRPASLPVTMPHLDHMQQGLERPTKRYFQFFVLAVYAPCPLLTAIDLLLTVMHSICWKRDFLLYLLGYAAHSLLLLLLLLLLYMWVCHASVTMSLWRVTY